MWVKNASSNEVAAKFDGKEIVFAAEQTINLAERFPENQVKQAADHFVVKYGFKVVQEPVVPAMPKIPAAEPKESAEEAKPEKKAGKKRG